MAAPAPPSHLCLNTILDSGRTGIPLGRLVPNRRLFRRPVLYAPVVIFHGANCGIV